MDTFAATINRYNRNLTFTGTLPPNVSVMNPYRDADVLECSSQFYNKYYSDTNPRTLILGINPGRFGAGVTGVPFTDPKRLEDKCGIHFHGNRYHEPSSEFVYDMIDAFGGPEEFYGKYYINSLSPLGFTTPGKKGKDVNFNYYDNKELLEGTRDFIISNINTLINIGFATNICYCLGTGKNFKFFSALNKEHNFFGTIIPLEHPRYIIQYKQSAKKAYIAKYLEYLK